MARLENAPAQETPGRDMRAWEVARLISEYVAPATTILFVMPAPAGMTGKDQTARMETILPG